MTKKLIWFVHFHKCAGTSFLELARLNGYKTYTNNQNGNPVDENGDVIELWKFCREKLDQFLYDCKLSGITLIATEWGIPDLDYLKNREDVELVTILRAPVQRYVSNFYFDVHHKFTSARSFQEYLCLNDGPYTQYNYYTKMLLRDSYSVFSESEINDMNLSDCLKSFDVIGLSENRLVDVSDALNFKYKEVRKNTNSLNAKFVILNLLRLDFEKIILKIMYKKKPFSDKELGIFCNSNKADICLYNAAKEIIMS